MREVHVAVAVIWRQGRLLIARRPDHVHQGGLLEFPGGKVEPGETVQQALVREIAEETGVVVVADALRPLIGIRHDYGDKRVFLDVWETDRSDGDAEGREGQSVSWMLPETLCDEEFPDANRPIIRAIRLPDRYGISGHFGGVAEGLSHLREMLTQSRLPLVVLRAPWLDDGDYLEMARQALPLCEAAGSRLMLHGAPRRILAMPEAAGIHLPWREACILQQRPLPAGQLLAVSCHSAEEIRHAQKLEADFITLGPVRRTASHPGKSGLGWQAFSGLVMHAGMPVYALGGVNADDIAEVRRQGGQGVAGIGFWW